MSARARHRRRGGVPPDALLAVGGRAADDRRQRRARHAALRADRPRDGRPARAGRLHHPRRPTRRSRSPTTGREHAEAIVRRHRLIERFLTDVARHPVGRGPRGGRAPRARDVPAARGADAAPRSATPRPARTATRSTRQPHRGRAAGRRRGGRDGPHPALRERGRGPAALPQATPAWSPAWRARSLRVGDDEVVGRVGDGAATVTRSRRRDRLGQGRPVAAARAQRCPSSSCSRNERYGR